MIEHKVEMFKSGVEVFVERACNGNQLQYTRGMVHQGGYLAACKEFFKYSGYLTQKDSDALINHDVVPPWMGEVFIQVEQQYFGISLWDKQ